MSDRIINPGKLGIVLVSYLILCFFPVTYIAANAETGITDAKFQINSYEEVERNLVRAVDFIDAQVYCEAEKILLDTINSEYDRKQEIEFILGRLYAERGSYEKAQEFLVRVSDEYPLLRDYALELLVDVYISAGRYDEAIDTIQLIENELLLQRAKQTEIILLLALHKDNEAKERLSEYTQEYPQDWEYKMTFAALLNGLGEINESVRIYKDVYLNAVSLSENALNELKVLEAEAFSKEEVLRRADNLFSKYDYSNAESTYKEILDSVDESQKGDVLFSIGMCQFRSKRYDEAARSFGAIETPKWMYWRARSFYRTNNHEEFRKVKTEFESMYPRNERLALLYLMEADELRRQGYLKGAENGYRIVSERFPESAEDALWGLAWMNYSSGNNREASNYFSKLTGFENSANYFKYLYWNARNQEKMAQSCIPEEENESEDMNNSCGTGNKNFFSELRADQSYYGYLINMRSPSFIMNEKIQVSEQTRPEGQQYERIEALAFLGMRGEAVSEVIGALNKADEREEILYLGNMAMKLGQYREIIYFAEPREDVEFLPYSYPRAYWDTIRLAAESHEIDKYLVAALIREESRYDPEIISWAGAIGLMQLMPATAKRMNDGLMIHMNDEADLFDAETNIYLGTRYLSGLLKEFEDIPFAIAAYNAGENAISRWLDEYHKGDVIEFIENIPYKETRRYVKKVLKSYWRYRSMQGLDISGIGG